MTAVPDIVELERTLYQSRNPTRRWLHTTRRDLIMDAVRRTCERRGRGRALEVGVGSGVYLAFLAELYDEAVGMDVEEAFLEAAEPIVSAHANLRLVKDDITTTNLARGQFDLVLCSEVIEHIGDSRLALSKIHGLLRPGGTLVLSTPQRWSLLELTAKAALMPGMISLVRRVYREPVMETGHDYLLTARQTVARLQEAGFEIREQFKSGMYVPFVAEVAGRTGLRVERWLERAVHGTVLDGLLWTQYYVGEA
jgi:2-polyprenyl-3-methyl-5-hydroxy-6-metoxy-1,4-benzoquinol methylase